ncbi:Wzz/FepE/Etk N-terminal domain-containing protein [Flavobacterium taihuense]|uniref:Polysaccharide chain length determinant N-terminal domain-containing protein n=1 Tax=Flavobacterium taihuense TaxID=2857508 RepID=A0ABS6XSM2_9FLAO|nr:Wzz/FepE/Etk N-terminal domain-containing protein [Flavobacterium taihuense]MBW4358894.1 hypothetical protein [Flavobacterium taihuense]
MQKIYKNDDEFISINLSPLIKIIIKEIKIILIFMFLFLLFGILYILNTPKEYVSIGKIMPEVAHKPSNGMGAIFETLKKYNGNLDLYNTEITKSDLYEDIVKTKDFYDYLLTKKVQTRNKKVGFKTYNKYNLIPDNTFISKINTTYKTNTRIEEYNIRQNIQKRITITGVKKNNVILVSVKMPDPYVASDIATYTIKYLIDYITKYRTEKARQELHFLENLLKEVMKDNLKNEVFSKEIQKSLLASIIQMKIKIEEDKPHLQILEQPEIPVINNESSKLLIILVSAFIGFTIGFIFSLFKNDYYRIIK